MHVFYCNEIGQEGGNAILEERENHHLFKTMRARNGEEIALCDGRGTRALARIGENRSVTVVSKKVFPEAAFKLHLYIAPPRKNKMDELLRHCTELGVWSINPVICERSVSEPDKNSLDGRWQTLLVEACKQSGNPFIPKIGNPQLFKDAALSAVSKGMNIFFGAPVSKDAPVSENDFSGTESGLFIGPEGGFSPAEEAMMRENGFKALQVGAWTLRVETAVVSCASVIMFRHGRIPENNSQK